MSDICTFPDILIINILIGPKIIPKSPGLVTRSEHEKDHLDGSNKARGSNMRGCHIHHIRAEVELCSAVAANDGVWLESRTIGNASLCRKAAERKLSHCAGSTQRRYSEKHETLDSISLV